MYKRIGRRIIAVVVIITLMFSFNVTLNLTGKGSLLSVGGNVFADTAMTGTVTNIKIAAGLGDHNLMLKDNGTVWAWGRNDYGQLGNGTTVNSSLSVQVSDLNDVIAVEGGYHHSIAVKSDKTVCSWGYNIYYQLDEFWLKKSLIPSPVFDTTISGGNAKIEAYNSIKASWTVNDGGSATAYALAAFDSNNVLVKQNAWIANLTDTLTDLSSDTKYKLKVKAKNIYDV